LRSDEQHVEVVRASVADPVQDEVDVGGHGIRT
jgi:hypothetical protein